MKASEIIFIVRKHSEAELLRELDPSAGGMRRLIVQVAGEANALNFDSLRRLRRVADPAKRKTPVVIWVANNTDAEKWREAGALALVGAPNVKAATKAIALARDVPWVESQVYIGPDRRHKKTWLNRTVRRLADSNVLSQPDQALADKSSFDTRMRQLRFAAFGMDKADRERRAQFLSDVRSAVKAAERTRRMHSGAVMESLARYLAARGAKGQLDQALIDKHLEVAEADAAQAAPLIPQLQRSVDRAIGLAQPA